MNNPTPTPINNDITENIAVVRKNTIINVIKNTAMIEGNTHH
jgi:hypothetical protein